MGVVYEAYDREREMRVALKALQRLDPDYLLRLKREFRALSNITHPNIIDLYELIAVGDEYFFTMELVEGEDIARYVSHAPVDGAPDATPASAASPLPAAPADPQNPWHEYVDPDQPRPPLDQIVDVQRLREAMAQLARALHALHAAGMVHCDLKPSNVMVTREGRVVLMDFGVVARHNDASGPPLGAASDGTPAFMAPEQARGEPPAPASDWYAFGVILYQLLTRRLPFQGSLAHMLVGKQETDPLPPSTFTSDLPPALQRVCSALLSRNPDDRPNIDEVLGALGGVDRATQLYGSALIRAVDSGADIFVGREHELALLHECYERAQSGAPRCVIVDGRSGMGKSSLLAYFLLDLHQSAPYHEAPLILAGRCHERESVAYKALDSVVDQLAAHLLRLPNDQRRELLPTDIALLSRLFPALQRVPGCELEQRLDGSPELRVRAMRALGGLLSHLAADRVVIVRLEDLQWADDESFELLLALLEPPAPAGLLFLATVRQESLTGQHPALGRFLTLLGKRNIARRISLGPLTGTEQRALVQQLGEQRFLRQRIGDELWRECGGHPMLLAELARYAEQAADELAPSGGLHLEDIIRQRVSRLPDSAQALLEVIAVAGEPVPLRVLAKTAALTPAERERARSVLFVTRLARLARVGAELWLDSYHDKVRESVLERLDSDHLRQQHRKLALEMEAWGEAPMALLARHWLAAGDRERAADYLLDAAENATEQLAFARAADIYRTVIDVLSDADDHRAADERRVRAWLALAQGLRIVDRRDQAQVLLIRAQQAAERHQLIASLADIHQLRGNLLYPTDDLDGCLAAHERARRYARQAESPEREAAALSGLGDAYYMRGRLISAYEHYDGCIQLCRQFGFERIEAANLAMRGIMYWFQNDLDAAIRDGLAAVEMAQACGHLRAELNARSGCLGVVMIEMGHLDEASQQLTYTREMARELGARSFEATALLFLGRVCQLQGRDAKAELLVGDSLEIFRQIGLPYLGPTTFGLLALVTDRPALRQRALAEAERLLRSGSGSHNYLYFYRYAIDLSLEHGDLGRVDHYADAFEDYMRAQPVPWSRFFVARARALARYARGHRDAHSQDQIRDLYYEAERAGLQVASAALHSALTTPP
ncbi:MAG: hypothetical protein Tsb0020_47610 [Haliangiales bacterium]